MVKVGESNAKAARAIGMKQNKLLGKLVGTARVAGTRSSIATKGTVSDKMLKSITSIKPPTDLMDKIIGKKTGQKTLEGKFVDGGKRAGGLLQKLQTSNAKDTNVEKSKRRKQLGLGIKASIATITSVLISELL